MLVTVALVLVLVLLLTAPVALAAGDAPWGARAVYGAGIAAGLGFAVLALLVLTGGADGTTLRLPLGLPWLGIHLRLDPLGAFFVLVVGLSAVTASLYGLGTGHEDPDRRRILPFFGPFLAAMNLVLMADDAFGFLLSWEFMSLTSWGMVLAHPGSADSHRAGLVYLIMAAIGTMALLLALGLLAGAESRYLFAEIRQIPHAPWVLVAVFLLALVGFGSKAGIVPLHAWLPLAHPAAPSHVSALMSGAMTKVALYGLIRLLFDLADAQSWWWGAILLALGGITAALGVLMAVLENDLKRLLAYSTVDNIGLVFIGLGLAIAFQTSGMAEAAAVAFTAALLHVFNHSLFKTLLFCGSGVVLHATGSRDMDRAGGLARRMPWASGAFLVGALAIAALPPLNGFASEWLTLQAILLSPELPQWLLRFLVPAVGALLALAAALAAACFVKAYGITFLGRPRSAAAAAAMEPPPLVLAALWLPAGLCIAAGLMPSVIITLIQPVAATLAGFGQPFDDGGWMTLVPVTPGRSAYNPLGLFVLIALLAALIPPVLHRISRRGVRRGPTWDCGAPDPSPATQYSAGSFSQPLRRTFGTAILQAQEQVDMPSPAEARPARLAVTTRDVIWDWLYLGTARLVLWLAGLVNPIQFLTVRRYLSLMFAALLVLLIGLSAWR